jgi:thioredoxin reductase (NADPH)
METMTNPPGADLNAPYDIVIVGSGPAGWTAAVYAARANLRTLVLAGQQAGGIPGGQLMLTTEVENYPGFAEGIQGPELMDRMRRQALRFGAEPVEEDVTGVDFSGRPLTLWAGERAYRGRAVILATGASARWLGLPSETRLRGRGVSACAVCDGVFFRDQDVAVVGGGDTALEEALHLTRFARTVTVVHRRDALRASEILRDRARAKPKIAWALSREVAEVLGDERVEGVRLRAPRTGEEETLPVRGVFVAIGHRPNTDPFRGQVALDAEGYVVATRRTETSVPGVFVAGDVRDRRYRQAITAAGEGAMAALDAEEFLTGEIRTDWAATAPVGDGEAAADGAPVRIRDARVGNDGALPVQPPKIVVYTTSWCPYCREAKRYLEERGLPYEEIDIERTPGAAERVERWSGGYRTVPTFDAAGRIIVGPDLAALEEALRSATRDDALVPA